MTSQPSVLLHPIVPINILNSFGATFNPTVNQSVGILLGSRKENSYEVKSSFTFMPILEPTADASEASIQKLLAMHHLVYKDEQLIGWFVGNQ